MTTRYSSISWLFVNRIISPNNLPTLPLMCKRPKNWGITDMTSNPSKKYLTIKSSRDYLHKVMLPPELSNLKFDKTLYNKVVKFLKENDPEMIYIYGGDDPWTASGVTWLKNKKNIKVYVLPGGSHTTRIGSFDTDTQEEIKTQINAWLNKE